MKHFALRVEDETFLKIEELSKKETRSINGQINVLLKKALDER